MLSHDHPRYYLSECGGYVARYIESGRFEVWTRDGARHWRHDNRIRTWKEAAQPLHPMEFSVGGYSAEKTGQKKGSFTLHLCHCDITKFIESWKGNTVIESLDIVFRRRIPLQNVPHWLKEACNARPR
jgi:hypothetical protein